MIALLLGCGDEGIHVNEEMPYFCFKQGSA